MRISLIITAAVLLAGLVTTVDAINMNFMKDAPMTRLSADEAKAFRAFVMKTLDEGADGATAEWTAPKTKFTSKVTPQKTSTEGKLRCRQARVESDAADRHARGDYVFCKGDKGDWQFKIPEAASKKQMK